MKKILNRYFIHIRYILRNISFTFVNLLLAGRFIFHIQRFLIPGTILIISATFCIICLQFCYTNNIGNLAYMVVGEHDGASELANLTTKVKLPVNTLAMNHGSTSGNNPGHGRGSPSIDVISQYGRMREPGTNPFSMPELFTGHRPGLSQIYQRREVQGLGSFQASDPSFNPNPNNVGLSTFLQGYNAQRLCHEAEYGNNS